jgi:hypothetical protein
VTEGPAGGGQDYKSAALTVVQDARLFRTDSNHTLAPLGN